MSFKKELVMSVSFADQEFYKIKIELGKSNLNPKKTVFVLTTDDNQLFPRAEIHLKVGNTYIFDINTPGCPFYVTSDSKGGGFNEDERFSMRGAVEINSENAYENGNVGIEKGTLTWTPDFIHKDMDLYYQCNYYSEMGNKIIISLN